MPGQVPESTIALIAGGVFILLKIVERAFDFIISMYKKKNGNGASIKAIIDRDDHKQLSEGVTQMLRSLDQFAGSASEWPTIYRDIRDRVMRIEQVQDDVKEKQREIIKKLDKLL